MSSGVGSLHRILKDETRRRIILLLREKESLSYVDLMKALGITNTGKMNYHLKVLSSLLSKKDDGQYVLSEKGMLASRLLLEFSETNAARQLRLSSRRPQVLWGGVIIFLFTLIGWFDLFRFLQREFTSGYATDVELSAPFFFVCAVFSFIGLYMIVSDLKKNEKTSRTLGKLAKSAVILSTIAIAILGASLVGVSITFPNSIEHLTEIAHQENPGAKYTIFSNGVSVYRADLVASNSTRLDQETFNVTVTSLEQNQTWTMADGTIQGQTLQVYLPLDVGHYEINWDGLNVTQITVYVRTGDSPSLTRLRWWTAGLFTLLAGAVSLFGFEVDQLFRGRRTGIFWWGLIILGLALSWLFGVLWFGVFPGATIYAMTSGLGSPYSIIQVLASLVFSFIGFRMMKRGTIKESQTYSALGSRISTLEFYLSQRNYRALVYLLASVLIIGASESGVVIGSIIMYIDFVGLILLFIFFGPPSMYGGWFNPASILPYALLVFGLFVEIFIVCEFFISLLNLANKTRESEPSISQRGE